MQEFSNSDAACYLDHPWNILKSCLFPQIGAGTGGSQALFGLLLGAGIVIPMWLADPESRIAAPTVLLILIGGALLPALPGNMRGAAWTLIILGMTAAIGVLAKRFILNPGVRV